MTRKKMLNYALLYCVFMIASGIWVYFSDYPENLRNFVLFCGGPVLLGTAALIAEWFDLHRKH